MRLLKNWNACSVAAALVFAASALPAVDARAQDGSASDLLKALVSGSIRAIERGDVAGAQTLGAYLDLPGPWRAQVRYVLEHSSVLADVRTRAAQGGDGAATWMALNNRLRDLSGLQQFANAAKASADASASGGNVALPAAVDAIQWLLVSGGGQQAIQLRFGDCHPAVDAFAIEAGQPGRALGSVSYEVGATVVDVEGATAVRLDSTDCAAVAQQVELQTLAGAQALPVDGRLAVGRYSTQLDDEQALELSLPTREGVLYDVMVAAADDVADPGVLLFRNASAAHTAEDDVFASDDDGGYGLGARVAGVLGDGSVLRVRVTAMEAQGGAVSIQVRASAPQRQRVGDTRSYRTVKGAPTVLQVPLRPGLYRMSTSQLSAEVDTVLAVFASPGNALVAENDDVRPSSFVSQVCINVATAGDYLVRIGFVEPASGSFDFAVEPAADCPEEGCLQDASPEVEGEPAARAEV